MNEEIEESGLIIQDFTAVSEWEIFILKIEEAINEWKLAFTTKERPLHYKEFSKFPWKITKECITFDEEMFTIVRYQLILPESDKTTANIEENEKHCQAFSDLYTTGNDFDSIGYKFINDVPPLAVWFGIRDFVVLSCGDIVSERRIKLLLSSISIAINNTGCEVPIFIQCREAWQNCYLGICESKGLCLKYDTIHLRKIPTQCYNLIGILDLFKGKIASAVSLDNVHISARFSYYLFDWPSLSWSQQPPDFDFMHGQSVGISNFSSLPFGAVYDPIKSFSLFATWMHLSDDTVIDSQSYTDFDPLQAPMCSMKIEMVDKSSCLLFDFYNEFLSLYKNNSMLSELLIETNNLDFNVQHSRFPIKNSIMMTSSKLKDISPNSTEKEPVGPISNEIIISLLKFLFSNNKLDQEQPIDHVKPLFYIGVDNLKASPNNSLVWRLAVASGQVSQALGGVNAVAQLWYEFCQELRHRWENSIVVPGLLDGFPNSRTCLLHQKLQMINICIDRRKRRDEAAKLGSASVDDQSSESDDEFYECDAEDNEGASGTKKTYLPWNRPVGRLGKFGNMKLIETGDALFVPITQEPVPKTEDQLEQDAEVMLKLGTDAQASEMRANIMSASLLSDMESFKAANPDGIFDDFVRWYSPRDWIEEENEDGEKKGHLSTRMLIPDNMWVKVWTSAKPVPAKRQRRLFDDTTEAEKILHFLESRSVAQIVDLLLPSLTHAVLSKVAGECENRPELPQLKPSFDRLLTSAMKFTRERVESEKYKTLSEYVYGIELAIAQSKSLRLKFKIDDKKPIDENMIKFLLEVMNGEEADLPGGARGAIGSHVVQMFQEASDVDRDLVSDYKSSMKASPFPTASQKEFVLRVMAKRPSSTSTSTLQMMRVIIKNDEFRVLGAFAEDVIFT